MYILDVEASGLVEESYPIQIGWQHLHRDDVFDEFLIKPHPDWVYWDHYAEKEIHHINRQQLISGIDIETACNRLNDIFSNEKVYSDCNTADDYWITRLFMTAHIEKRFSILSVFDLVPKDKKSNFKKTLRYKKKPHTALADSRIIRQTLLEIHQEFPL